MAGTSSCWREWEAVGCQTLNWLVSNQIVKRNLFWSMLHAVIVSNFRILSRQQPKTWADRHNHFHWTQSYWTVWMTETKVIQKLIFVTNPQPFWIQFLCLWSWWSQCSIKEIVILMFDVPFHLWYSSGAADIQIVLSCRRENENLIKWHQSQASKMQRWREEKHWLML